MLIYNRILSIKHSGGLDLNQIESLGRMIAFGVSDLSARVGKRSVELNVRFAEIREAMTFIVSFKPSKLGGGMIVGVVHDYFGNELYKLYFETV